jgi:AcrR family transcriptional regulator
MPRRPRPSPERERRPSSVSSTQDPRSRIVDALMALAAERPWEEITLSDIAREAGVSLSELRDHFISKGAILGAFSRRIDKIVLEGTSEDLAEESAKDRLFDVLMRRLDALAPYKAGLESVFEWANRETLAAFALNRQVINSMRFMLEAAGIDTEGPVGALKLQGLVFAWRRVLIRWFHDDDPGLAPTMAVLDRELARGGHWVARANDLHRLASPLRSLARAMCRRRSRRFEGARERWRGEDRDSEDGAEAVV